MRSIQRWEKRFNVLEDHKHAPEVISAGFLKASYYAGQGSPCPGAHITSRTILYTLPFETKKDRQSLLFLRILDLASINAINFEQRNDKKGCADG